VGRPDDFAALHGDLTPAVAGMFRGDLENDGERIVLLAADDSVIRDFTYNDKHPWPESADGDGYSLVLIAPLTDPDHDDPLNWRSSAAIDGTPAGSDAASFVGDPAADLDHDGMGAFLEHALGTSDTDPTNGRSAFGWSGTSTPLRLSLQQNLSADDALLELEISSDMQAWTPADTAFELISRSNNGDGTATLLYEQIGPPRERLFVRARASLR
jgi:hypothetical protein